jgi:hypothetical protein
MHIQFFFPHNKYVHASACLIELEKVERENGLILNLSSFLASQDPSRFRSFGVWLLLDVSNAETADVPVDEHLIGLEVEPVDVLLRGRRSNLGT